MVTVRCDCAINLEWSFVVRKFRSSAFYARKLQLQLRAAGERTQVDRPTWSGSHEEQHRCDSIIIQLVVFVSIMFSSVVDVVYARDTRDRIG